MTTATSRCVTSRAQTLDTRAMYGWHEPHAPLGTQSARQPCHPLAGPHLPASRPAPWLRRNTDSHLRRACSLQNPACSSKDRLPNCLRSLGQEVTAQQQHADPGCAESASAMRCSPPVTHAPLTS
eukprot:366431-Chlamydomonas_euryale.AAC.20